VSDWVGGFWSCSDFGRIEAKLSIRMQMKRMARFSGLLKTNVRLETRYIDGDGGEGLIPMPQIVVDVG
jgi:hypothetical protein